MSVEAWVFLTIFEAHLIAGFIAFWRNARRVK